MPGDRSGGLFRDLRILGCYRQLKPALNHNPSATGIGVTMTIKIMAPLFRRFAIEICAI
jgi:hypothetical protein